MKKTIKHILLIISFLSVSFAAYAEPYTGADITLLGDEFSATSGFTTDAPESGAKMWYSTSEGALYTYWAHLWVEYTVNLDKGNWNMGLNVTNHGNIDKENWYSYFLIYNTGTNSTIKIDASDDETNYGLINMNLLNSGDYTIRYTWVNDKYSPSEGLDANIQIDSVFFDNTETAPVPEPATMFLLGSGLMAFAGYRRKKTK